MNIRHSISKQLTVCLRFPDNYPDHHVLVELKSKTLCDKVLHGLTTIAEQQAKDFLGTSQARIYK